MSNKKTSHKTILSTQYQLLVEAVPTIGRGSTNYWYVAYQPLMHLSRTILLLILLVLGNGSVWGQTPDYSGTYYIAYFGNNKYDPTAPSNTDNHYWCPVDCSGTWKAWFKYNDDPDYDNYSKTENTGMEFLTTYRFKKDNNYDSQNALWVITKHETIANAYYIQHRATQKYLTMNDYMQNTSGTGQNRLRVHIQSDIASDNKSLFTIKQSQQGIYFLICPLSLDGNQWINVSTDANDATKQNKDANSLIGTNTKTGVSGLDVGGTLGFYTSGDGDNNSKWYLEKAKCKTPVITFDNVKSEVTITSDDDETIYYTTDGSNPDANFAKYSEPFALNAGAVIKAISKRDGIIDSEIATLTVEKLATPSISFNEETREVTITAAEGVEIYYTTNDTDPSIEESTAHGESPVVIEHALPSTMIHARAVKSGYINSDVVTKIDIPVKVLTNPTIILAEDEFVYDGSAKEPAITVKDGDVVVSADEYVVTYSNNTNAGTASVTISDKTDGDYQVNDGSKSFTISPKSLGDGTTAAEGITVEMTEDGSLSAVKDGSTTLVENTDYTQETVEEGNDKIITITGKGNYTGIVKGIYASPAFVDPDGGGSGQAAAVYQAKRDLSCPTGIKPYIIRKVNPSIGTAVITQLDYIPEDVPVLLLSDDEASGFIASPKDPSTPEVTAQTKNSNLLKVSAGGEEVEAARIYVFYKGEFVLTKAGTLSEGKFYLYNPNYANTSTSGNSGGSEARGSLQFIIDDEETTGITELENSTTKKQDTDIWYTLDGRRLSVKPSKAGIYIHQGQKEYIKR